MVGVTAYLGSLLGLLHPAFGLPRDSRISVVRYTSSAGSVHPDPSRYRRMCGHVLPFVALIHVAYRSSHVH